MKLFKVYTLTFTFLILSRFAFAEPMFIYFHEMIQNSKLIVKGTYLGSNNNDTVYNSFEYYFQVDEVLKGNAQKEKLTFKRAHGAVFLEPGTEYVAFINQDNAFEWVGIDKVGKKITPESVLFLQGFYDYNAYLVSPGVMSYSQLNEYIKTGSFKGSIYGDVHFFDTPEKRMKPSSINIEVKYSVTKDIINSEVLINGIELNNFTNKPSFSIPCWDDIFTVQYEPNMVRPLTLNGKLNNLHPSANRFRVTYWVTEPEELSYEEFLNYINNEANGPGTFVLELLVDNNKKYTIKLNEESGRIGTLYNYDGKNLSISSLSTAPNREIVFGYPNKLYKLILDSCKLKEIVFEYAEDDLVFELKHGDINGKMINITTNQPTGNCILKYKSTQFTNNVNYGK